MAGGEKEELGWSGVPSHIAGSHEWAALKAALLDSPGGGPAVAALAEQLLKTHGDTSQDKDLNKDKLSSLGKVLQEVTWEKLHSGIWRDVPDSWRDAYTLACILSAVEVVQHSTVQQEKEFNPIGAALRHLDLAALMGGPAFRPLVDALINDVATRQIIHPPDLHYTSNSAPTEATSSRIFFLEGNAKPDAGIILGEEKVAVALPPGSMGPRGVPVPEENLPSLDTFAAEYLGTSPVVISGAMAGWPALQRWRQASYLLNVAGHRTVPVEVGRSYMDEGWGQSLMLFSKFLNEHLIGAQDSQSTQVPGPGQQQEEEKEPSSAAEFEMPSQSAAETRSLALGVRKKEAISPGDTPSIYLAQHDLLAQIPALAGDVIEPEYCVLGRAVRAVNTWIGPPGTITPPHTDPHQNLLCQIVGRKYVRLYSPEQTGALYPDQ